MSTYIFESKKIESILDFIDLDTFVIFDIDHTLIETPQVIGSCHWEKHLKHRLMDEGVSDEEASAKACALWKKIQKMTEVQAIEEGIYRLITFLKTHQIPTLGLTARDADLIDLTFKQLQTVNLHDIFTLDYPCQPLVTLENCHFSRGAVFCGPHTKDNALMALMKTLELQPKKIAYIDDQKEHLYKLEELAYSSNIEFVGMQYMASSYDRFNLEIAQIQEKHLPQILSNADAIKLMRDEL